MDKGVSEYREQPVQSPKESRTAGMEWVGEGGRVWVITVGRWVRSYKSVVLNLGDFAPKGHLGKSGDFWGCQIGGREGTDI